ncbi:MAG: TonB-dependent receptor plug domain-containing protein [Bacteroidetes bacterium]|nr:TonB-dependent receptor plug domain-containing protein [Bacteroidota bacterium]
MNERPGYFINNFGPGGRNLINFNGFSPSDIGIFRDGIQSNDILFGGFDVQNISVNEIDKTEEVSGVSSFFYGFNTPGKAINIITKDAFRTKPFSQFRYSQDRFNSLDADLVFNLPFSKKINWMAGITKHSVDGRYENSGFDVWRARTRLSYYLSPKFNLKADFNFSKITRGLNEGLIFTSDKDSLSQKSAAVVNPSSGEVIENYFYNIALTGRFFKDKNSLTKLTLYSNNTIRDYSNSDTITVGTSNYFSPPAKYHYIQYAADLSQNLNYRLSRKSSLEFIFGGNVYLNYYNYANHYINDLYSEIYSLKLKSDFKFENLFLSVFVKANAMKKDVSLPFYNNLSDKNNYTNVNTGAEAGYKFTLDKNKFLKLYGGVNNISYQNEQTLINAGIFLENTNKKYYQYLESGLEFNIKDKLDIKSFYFHNGKNLFYSRYRSAGGVNTSLNYYSSFADAYISYNYINSDFFPKHNIKSDISYHNFLFKNKLRLRTGFNIKYFSAPENSSGNVYYEYSQSNYSFYHAVSRNVKMSGFQTDFYVGARIGHANVNLTIANIFNTFYYDTLLYPADDLGGFVNSISRFTIVWDFLN